MQINNEPIDLHIYLNKPIQISQLQQIVSTNLDEKQNDEWKRKV